MRAPGVEIWGRSVGPREASEKPCPCISFPRVPCPAPEDPRLLSQHRRTTTRSPAFDPSSTSPCFMLSCTSDDASCWAIGLRRRRVWSLHAVAAIPMARIIQITLGTSLASHLLPWSLHHLTAMISVSVYPQPLSVVGRGGPLLASPFASHRPALPPSSHNACISLSSWTPAFREPSPWSTWAGGSFY